MVVKKILHHLWYMKPLENWICASFRGGPLCDTRCCLSLQTFGSPKMEDSGMVALEKLAPSKVAVSVSRGIVTIDIDIAYIHNMYVWESGVCEYKQIYIYKACKDDLQWTIYTPKTASFPHYGLTNAFFRLEITECMDSVALCCQMEHISFVFFLG